MSALSMVRSKLGASVLALHDDEEGLNTIEMVLIVCVAATLLAVLYKFLWGKDNSGIVAQKVQTTVNSFFGIFTGNF